MAQTLARTLPRSPLASCWSGWGAARGGFIRGECGCLSGGYGSGDSVSGSVTSVGCDVSRCSGVTGGTGGRASRSVGGVAGGGMGGECGGPERECPVVLLVEPL
jgi:hypothetical protein